MSSLSLRPLSVTSCDPSRLPPIHETHTRPVPLPHYVSIETDDPSLTAGHYAGHGQSKICYRLCTSIQNWRDAPQVLLKLTPNVDQEPILFAKLPNEISPAVYDHVDCRVYLNKNPHSAEQPVIWNAWTTDLALPCDQALEAGNIDLTALVWQTLLCLCLCAHWGLLVTDNALFNFGVLNGRVVLIDAGSRQCEESPVVKTRLTASLNKFWYKLNWYVKTPEHRQTAQNVRQHFLDAYWSPQDVSLDQVTQNLRVLCAKSTLYIARPAAPIGSHSAALPAISPGSAAQPATMPPTPAAKEFLRDRASDVTEADYDMLDWLYDTFLYGKLGKYVLGECFRIVYDANATPSPLTKLEILLRITQVRRETVLGQGTGSKDMILSNAQMKELLDQWKQEYWTWMHQNTQDQWHGTSRQQWHQIQRRAFRTHLWEIIGCYEMTLVFLHAPCNRKNLTIFKNEWRAWTEEETGEEFVKNVIEAIRTATFYEQCAITCSRLLGLQNSSGI